MTHENMPKLPKPAKLRRQMRGDGGYDMVPAYSTEEAHTIARAYAEQQTAELHKELDKLRADIRALRGVVQSDDGANVTLADIALWCSGVLGSVS